MSVEERSTANEPSGTRKRKLSLHTKLAFSSGGFGLDFIGFPDNADVGELAPQVVNALLFMSGPLYLMIAGLGIAFMLLCRLNAKRHQEILDVLEERRAANETE
jgi:Na+/melibiose symporter-like transporter